MTPDKTKIVTIEKDEYHGVFIFKFPYLDESKQSIYSMIGRLYIELGEDQLVSYSIGLTEKNILEVKIRIDWESEKKEQLKLQEVLQHWLASNASLYIPFCPLNFDLVVSSSFWDKLASPRTVKTNAGKVGRYSGFVLRYLDKVVNKD